MEKQRAAVLFLAAPGSAVSGTPFDDEELVMPEHDELEALYPLKRAFQ
jgi:hypothetical protein